MLWVVLLGFEAESEGEKKSRDQRDRLDGARAQIAVRRLSEELKKSTRKEEKVGHRIASCLLFTRLGEGFLYELRVAGSKHKYAMKGGE